MNVVMGATFLFQSLAGIIDLCDRFVFSGHLNFAKLTRRDICPTLTLAQTHGAFKSK